jgi:hypothetical protein
MEETAPDMGDSSGDDGGNGEEYSGRAWGSGVRGLSERGMEERVSSSFPSESWWADSALKGGSSAVDVVGNGSDTVREAGRDGFSDTCREGVGTDWRSREARLAVAEGSKAKGSSFHWPRSEDTRKHVDRSVL